MPPYFPMATPLDSGLRVCVALARGYQTGSCRSGDNLLGACPCFRSRQAALMGSHRDHALGFQGLIKRSGRRTRLMAGDHGFSLALLGTPTAEGRTLW